MVAKVIRCAIFEEHELYDQYGGYPTSNHIARHDVLPPDLELFIRLSSWHEKGQNYQDVKNDITGGKRHPDRRYKVFAAAQVSATPNLMAGEALFIQLFKDFSIRRGYAVWLNPDCSGRTPFAISPVMANFLSKDRRASTFAIDSLALHPSASPVTNSVNARLLTDLLFRT